MDKVGFSVKVTAKEASLYIEGISVSGGDMNELDLIIPHRKIVFECELFVYYPEDWDEDMRPSHYFEIEVDDKRGTMPLKKVNDIITELAEDVADFNKLRKIIVDLFIGAINDAGADSYGEGRSHITVEMDSLK